MRLTTEAVRASLAGDHGGRLSTPLSESERDTVTGFVRNHLMLPAPDADTSAGRAIYARSCSICHGDRGDTASWAKNSLNPPPADFTSHGLEQLSREKMIDTVTFGEDGTAMMAFAVQLSHEEIAATVDYIRTAFMAEGAGPGDADHGQGGDHVPMHHETVANDAAPFPGGLVGDPVWGKAFYEANCAECHGANGDGQGRRAYFMIKKPENFRSREARAEFDRPELLEEISAGVTGSTMSAWDKVLTPQEIANVAEYVYRAFLHPDRFGPVGSSLAPGWTRAEPAPAEAKKLICPDGVPAALAAGCAVYNQRCYFCHGYDGDAETVAAAMLDPPPRDFTRTPQLDRARIAAALREGRPGTAMQSFAGQLMPGEIEAVADFVAETFVACGARNTAYHTAPNGWPDHLERYGAAVPFVTGELPVDAADDLLLPEQRAGRALFRSACVSCHEGRLARPTPLAMRPAVEGGGERDLWSGTAVRGEPAGEYGAPTIHDIPPSIDNLTEAESVGFRLYGAACAECHAADGSGRNWVGAFLRPGPADFGAPAFARSFDTERLVAAILDPPPGTAMPSFRRVLSRDQAAAIAAYVRRAFGAQ